MCIDLRTPTVSNWRKIRLTILQFLALAENVNWYLMKEEQGLLYFAPVKTVARLCHRKLLKPTNYVPQSTDSVCLASDAG